jgi:hypothetical protein
MTRIITFSPVFFLISCFSYINQGTIKPEYVRIPKFVEELIRTNEGEFYVIVNQGDCLSCIVERNIYDYLILKGYQGILKFENNLYSIVNSIKTRSSMVDVIYPGEIIHFRYPEFLKISRLDYYRKTDRVYGLDDLKKLLDFYYFLPYTAGYFNCSERAAFVEYYLENKGFNADIAENGNHAWCLVEVEPGEWINVESVTSPPIIGKPITPYNARYKTIWDAIKVHPNEYDWWNRVNGVVIGREY